MAKRSGEKKPWPIHEAKAELAALVHAAEDEGPQPITRHGQTVAVVLSARDYAKLAARSPRGNLAEFFARVANVLEIPDRDRTDLTRRVEF
jgi:prevent-host-death family protein